MVGRGEGTKGKSTGHCLLRGRSQTLRSHPTTAQSPSGLSQPWDCPCSLVSPALPDRPVSGLRMSSESGTWGFSLLYPRNCVIGTTVPPLKACCARMGMGITGPGCMHSQEMTQPSNMPALCWAWGCTMVGGPFRSFQIVFIYFFYCVYLFFLYLFLFIHFTVLGFSCSMWDLFH